jgi:endoglucanase
MIGRTFKTCAKFLAAGIACLVLGVSPSVAQEIKMVGSVTDAEWGAYKQKFVQPNGRVVDDGNGGISHTESQGYGMLLAVAANDPAGFEQIWTFTRTQMLLRDDGLAAWKWDPNAKPHITDINNATDGDILIAYALGLAGTNWKQTGYTRAARSLAKAISTRTIAEHNGMSIMLPGASGFAKADRADGPVVNPSYWIFEAFDELKRLDPETDWASLQAGGLKVLDMARTGPSALPPEWLSLAGTPHPADGFPVQFSYNAIRIPLYLLRAGLDEAGRLAPYKKAWASGIPSVVNLSSGAPATQLGEPGYRMVAASLFCALDKAAVPASLKQFSPTLYYPSTLHLLGLSLVRQRYSTCL